MRIYEYGQENPECILLIHPSLVTWNYFENVIPLRDILTPLSLTLRSGASCSTALMG